MKNIISGISGMLGNSEISSLSPNELRSLYNTVVVISPLITFNREKDFWVSALEMLCDSLGLSEEEVISQIKKNASLGKPGKMSSEKIAFLDGDSLAHGESGDLLKSTVIGSPVDPEKIDKMKSTLSRIKSILKSINNHTKRISIAKSEDITPDMSGSIVIISRKE